ncbi:uncharacterized protein M6B38_314450 [Iris pallida]|uniref:F-box/LRR-repeat protein 15/At3g58940/PEG3-like LRR domain-containing protein n=1 Tax=Iris pallida TaxID=29817 RepID=A0AAX6HG49_IRIPA|nr:uncharacterized protein M6B38_344555 [Iris pallida]KAJ6839617.1 uncharacterized protein M6B38_314450 [Iris pallida]
MEPTKTSDTFNRINDGPSDRISQLPDPVLGLILCKVIDTRHTVRKLMDTRHVVKTMILSKRWRNLWASVPCLCFYDWSEDFPNLVSFVNTVLQLRDSSDIHTFLVAWHHSVNVHRDHHLTTWTEHIVGRNIKVLELDIYAGDHAEGGVEFPSCIFTCQTLEELKLSMDWKKAKLNPLAIIQLSRLRKLDLYGFDADCDSLKRLISGCPVLEDLKFFECKLHDPDISSDRLRQLIIECNDITGSQVRIYCPNLRSLTFNVNSFERVRLLWENVSSVVDATIQTEDDSGDPCFPVDVDVEPPKSITSRNKYVSRASGFPLFWNLKRLELSGRYLEFNFATVVYFLQHLPKLELLTLHKDLAVKKEEVWCYNCPLHYKLTVIFICDEENEKVIELMDDLVGRRCDCPWE